MKKIFCYLLLFFCISCQHLNQPRVFSSFSSKKTTQRSQPRIRVSVGNKIIIEPLEKYVAHVLPGEVSETWPMEALKAQAIAIRTFALKKMSEQAHKNFDVHSTVLSQVYKKKTKEVFALAAKETKGLALGYKDGFAESSFHSTCGGIVASAGSVWGKKIPYLEDKPCAYCSASPTFKWKTNISLKELSQKLGYKVTDIRILSKEKDRVNEFIINNSKKITGQDFRMKVGSMKIKSTLISSLKIEKNTLFLEGGGFGHGVGMCQYGALGMAKSGKNFKEILKYYYPKTKLIKHY